MRVLGLFSGFFTIVACAILAGQVEQNLERVATPSDVELRSETNGCGTKIDWIDNQDEAFAEARRLNRPVFVLHLSGNLRNEHFT